jgi:DNA-binding transcriptional MerR regulator
MKMSIAERRQIENEMIFRRANEKVGVELDEVDALLDELESEETTSSGSLIRDENVYFKFLCECSDENCTDRILMELAKYQELHLNRDRFIIKINHQVESIEKIIFSEAEYYVVEKNKSTSDPGKLLNQTSIDNT